MSLPRCIRCTGCLIIERIPFTTLRDIRCIACGWRAPIEPLVATVPMADRLAKTLCNGCHDRPVVVGYEYCQFCKSRRLVRRVG